MKKELNKYTSNELTIDNTGAVLSKNNNIELHDKNGNKVVVPAGFKVVKTDNLTVEKGIVVEEKKVTNMFGYHILQRVLNHNCNLKEKNGMLKSSMR